VYALQVAVIITHPLIVHSGGEYWRISEETGKEFRGGLESAEVDCGAQE
jgi:hypothetical protein